MQNKEEVNITIPKPEWKKVADGDYSEDHVINAYLSGKESALKEVSDALSRQKVEYLAQGMEYTDRLLADLQKQYNIAFEKVFLRQIDFKHIDVIIVLPADTYFSEIMSAIYEAGFAIEDETEGVELTFSYNYSLSDIDVNKMIQDGYIFSREP